MGKVSKNEEVRKIPIKNYLILAFIGVVTVILTLYINAWIKTYKVNKMNMSPFEGVVQQVNINELGMTLAETNQIIMYVSNDIDYEFESNILKRIKKEELTEYFYYVDVSEVSSEECIKVLKNNFTNISDSITEVPMFIYIKNGNAIKVIDSNNRELNIGDLEVIIDSYIEE